MKFRYLAKLIFITLLTLSMSGLANNKGATGKVELAGSTWVEGLEAAQQQAKRENKPILLLEMMGRLDEKWC